MKITVKIPKLLFDKIHQDLSRPHAFAYERVGFLFGSTIHLSENWIVLLNEYSPVTDADYIPDSYVGAKINSNALRTAMQVSLTKDLSAFHIHNHSGKGVPWFSTTDTDSLQEIIPPFTVVSPNQLHGGIVLSQNNASCLSWLFEINEPFNSDVSIVGFPTIINKPKFRRKYE